jgi:phospholipid/cholesterol/gamma-HCH transport system ATP-binding protein
MNDSKPQSPSRPSRSANSGESTEVQVEDLHKSFGDHAVLKGVNFTVARGEMVAIVGGSGSGKSVFFKHVIGLLRPDQGRVLLADHETPDSPLVDLATLDEPRLERIRRHCGVVFQQNALYSGSVHDNITLALEEVQGKPGSEADDAARSAIESVGLDVEQVWNQEREELSGGMAKRIAIARALATDPVLILYDEPTTGLDPESAAIIYQLIDETHQAPSEAGLARTSLIITHDKDLLSRLQPRVTLLHDGKVEFDGIYSQFEKSDSPIIKPYFQLMPALHSGPRQKDIAGQPGQKPG